MDQGRNQAKGALGANVNIGQMFDSSRGRQVK